MTTPTQMHLAREKVSKYFFLPAASSLSGWAHKWLVNLSARADCFWPLQSLVSILQTRQWACNVAGVGLDFSSAAQVIFAELPDEVSLLRQAEDRAHRQGQINPVNVYFLVIKHPLEERR